MPTPAHRSTEVALVGMRFHVRVGILPHEQELAQPLEVDLRVRLRGGASAVLDYRRLHALVTSQVQGKAPHAYLETLANAMLDDALALDGVRWARVVIRKPHVALDGPLDWAEVVLEGDASDA